jgi:hypothetical protein
MSRAALLAPFLFLLLATPSLADEPAAVPDAPAAPAALTPAAPAPGGLGARPGGLSALGAPGGMLVVDPRAIAFENEVVGAVNAARRAAGALPLVLDERLRAFCRTETETAVRTANVDWKATSQRLKEQELAGTGHRLQFAFGPAAGPLVDELLAKADVKAALVGDFQRAGVGAVLVPAKKPFFQVTLVLVRDPDPMAGKPGLSPEQTDPVINSAQPAMHACYDQALTKDPNLGGDVLIELVIGPSGKVDSAKLLKGLHLAAFDDCALGVSRALVFPAPYKGKPVSLFQPMRFMPPQGEKRVGRLAPAQVTGTFGLAAHDFQACFIKASIGKPNLGGAFAVAISIAPDGAVSAAAAILDEPGDATLTACVMERVRALHFPRPEFGGPVDLTYRLTFSPGAM